MKIINQTSEAKVRQKSMDKWMGTFRTQVGIPVDNLEAIRIKMAMLCAEMDLPYFTGFAISSTLGFSYNVSPYTRMGSW